MKVKEVENNFYRVDILATDNCLTAEMFRRTLKIKKICNINSCCCSDCCKQDFAKMLNEFERARR